MQNINIILESAINEAIAEIKSASQAAGQVATGKTLRSLEGRVEVSQTGYTAMILGRKYFGALETGSGPARRKGTDAERREFIESLKEWCRVRGFTSGGLSDEQYERLAKWLAWRIKKYGTQLYQKGGRRDVFTPAVDKLTANLLETIPTLFAQQIVNDFTQGFQGFGNSPLSVEIK